MVFNAQGLQTGRIHAPRRGYVDFQLRVRLGSKSRRQHMFAGIVSWRRHVCKNHVCIKQCTRWLDGPVSNPDVHLFRASSRKGPTMANSKQQVGGRGFSSSGRIPSEVPPTTMLSSRNNEPWYSYIKQQAGLSKTLKLFIKDCCLMHVSVHRAQMWVGLFHWIPSSNMANAAQWATRSTNLGCSWLVNT